MSRPLPVITQRAAELPADGSSTSTGERTDVLSRTLWINEVFYSVQGEGLDVGLPCVFVRLAGCNLRCSYCDTDYAWKRDGARELAIRDILRDVASYGTDLVEITGGEPLLQPAVISLMRELVDRGWRVLLETSGHEDASAVPQEVLRIIDVKTPGSGMSHGRYAANLISLRPTDQIKFVILDRADYEWAKAKVAECALVHRAAAVFFSPAHDELSPRTLAEWILADRLPVRLHVQLHKYIWGPDWRGV